ncbi:hypothetical protein GCM10022243_19400 [Saccharothrix violaceirubra]|uniref:DNA-binding SARP family transcriptional activator n=1 Tax=Saccharothrix violaceirubra TaxID=413306 RepID=A0A7W7T223_9PSEU|nr:BTAD domain-containing putative transcriptional regulator [Saccharothrix violaceirubra]MBB4965152.1 DNA-binding SARP family transcriptional activator [Saccharothrix violaceirubra]
MVVVLGRPGVLVDGVVVHPARRRVRLLLGLLAVRADRALSSEWLIDALWPGRPPVSAAANVRSHLAELRRVLRAADPDGPGIVASGDGYVLVSGVDGVDVTRFRRLKSEGRTLRCAGAYGAAARCLTDAVDLWRGPVMSGVPVPDAVRADVTVLDEQRVDAWEELMDVRLALGAHQDLVPVLAGLVVEHPLRERLWCQLVTALCGAGRRSEAVAVYQRLVRVLDTELGVEPCPESRALYEAIRGRA